MSFSARLGGMSMGGMGGFGDAEAVHSSGYAK